MNDLDDAAKATKRAAIAGVAVGVMTLIVTLVVTFGSPGEFEEVVSVWSLVDVVLLFALSFGVYKKSRIAAVGLLGYYLVNQVIVRIETGTMGGIPLAILFTAMFAWGTYGAFSHHRMKREQAEHRYGSDLELPAPGAPEV